MKPSGGAADLEDLRDEGRIARDPVAHHDTSAGLRDADHLLRDIERARREHGAEDGDHEVEAVRLQSAQIAGVALGEPAIREPEFLCAPVAARDEVRGDVDAQYLSAEPGGRDGRCAFAASEIKDPHLGADPETSHQRFAAAAHRRRDLREVALLP